MSRILRYALCLVALAGCTKARTEAVVLVTTDGVAVPTDVDSIQLTVADVTDPTNPVFQKNFRVCGGAVGDNCLTLPLAFTLIPGAHRDHSSRVQVTAMRGAQPVIDDAAVFTFAEGVSLRLDFVLYANCLGNTDCALRDQACGPDRMCAPVPSTPISGDPDLSASMPDLGGGDLSMMPPDLAGDDLAQPVDLAEPTDLAIPRDLSMPPDFSSCVPSCPAQWCGDDGCGTPCLCVGQSVCVANACTACGALGQMCCSGACNLGLMCDGTNVCQTPPDMSSNDGGVAPDQVLHWTASASYDTGVFYSVWGLSTTVYAVGDKGTLGNPIWKRPAAGTTLQFSPDTANSSTTTLRSVWGRSKSSLYAVGDNATILALNGSWAVVTGSGLPSTVPLNGVWIGAPGSPTFWVVGGAVSGSCMDTAAYNHFTTAWGTPFSSSLDCAFGGVWSDGAGGAVLAANGSKIQYSTDDGTTINGFAFEVGKSHYLHGVWGSSMNDVRVVGDGGVIYHWSLNGGTPLFSKETSNATVALRGIHGSAPNDLWAVGGSQVLHSTGDGTWTVQTNLPNNMSDLYGVYALSATDVYVVGMFPSSGQKIILHGGP